MFRLSRAARILYNMSYHVPSAGETRVITCAQPGSPQIIGAVPGIQHDESRVTTDGKYSPNVVMSIKRLSNNDNSCISLTGYLTTITATYH